jgi:hypothetical protein
MAVRSAGRGRAVPWIISVERQRGANDPLGPAMGPRVQLVVDGHLLLSFMLDCRRLVAEKNCPVGGFCQEQEVEAPPLQRSVLLCMICALTVSRRRSGCIQGHHRIALQVSGCSRRVARNRCSCNELLLSRSYILRSERPALLPRRHRTGAFSERTSCVRPGALFPNIAHGSLVDAVSLRNDRCTGHYHGH